jgi:hypothetical protein
LAVEARFELQNSSQYHSLANAATRGHGNYHGRGGRDGGRGSFGHGYGRHGEAGSSSGPKLVCELCKKTGHMVTPYWKCFDRNFTGEEKMVNNVEPGYNIDTAWYSDTGATDHITAEFEKLAMREKYTGGEQIHAANGGDMRITHVGNSILYTSSCILSLKNVTYVPSSKKNLVSIHRFTRDNHVLNLVYIHRFTCDNHVLLSNIPISFWLRIQSRGRYSYTVGVKVDTTHFPLWNNHHQGVS